MPTESLLLIVIVVYLASAIVWGLAKNWKYLKTIPDEKVGKEYYLHDERIVLTLAGFSLTALSLLISIQSKELAQISSTLLFFSIAFSSLVLSSIFIRAFRFLRFFIYLSDVLLNVGLLAFSCGFLVFFADRFSWNDGSTIVFAVLVFALFCLTLANYFFFSKTVSNQKRSEKIE
jgi:hypothetical protein